MDTGESTAETELAQRPEPSFQRSKHAFADGPRSLGGLHKWARFGLITYMVVEAVLLIFSVLLIWLYLPSTIVPFTDQQLGLIDMGLIVFYLAQTVMFWLCAILVARWTYRAMKNLYTAGSNVPEMSPGWAVGWYFIPFANLVQPARGMSQIYHGTLHAVGEAPPSDSRIALWWTFWLLTNISANISMRITGWAGNSNVGIASFSFDAGSSLFGVLSAWALMRLLAPISEKQELLKHGGVARVFD